MKPQEMVVGLLFAIVVVIGFVVGVVDARTLPACVFFAAVFIVVFGRRFGKE